MSVTRPCIVGQMGSTKFYETTMTGRELAGSVRPAMETDAWATAGIDERMQRKFDLKRIRASLVPYLAQHPDRFFGSIIVLVAQGGLKFDALMDVGEVKLDTAYEDSAANLGFVTLFAGEHIALDGQHRLLAFREVVGGGPELGEFANVVGDDDVCVLLIEFESARKTRRIFNKVNRHAKPTGRSDNIITSEDDGFAIVTRWLLDEDREAPLARREIDGEKRELVNWTSNTLSQNSVALTTISTVYETAKSILNFSGFEGFDEKKNPIAPPEPVLEKAYETLAEWWRVILSMDVFGSALDDMSSIPEARFDPEHPHSLLLRPVGQVAFVDGLVMAVDRSGGELSLTKAVERANKIDFSSTVNSFWRNTIVGADGRKMVARKDARNLAAELVAWLIGREWVTVPMQENLWEMWNRARGKDVDTPVDQIENDDQLPEDLPPPISD